MQDAIPTPILQFLREHIRSVVQLELLLMLHKQPERAWGIAEVSEQLYIPNSFSESILESLRRIGLVAVTEESSRQYRYAPAAPELVPLIDDLARIYQERPHSTIHVIYTSQTDQLQNFADAFRIRKKENE
ncbi:MAG: hypothetical protein AB7O26_15580 [Planctomycetaceae bacterium]